MRSRMCLHLIDPDPPSPREAPGDEAHEVALLEQLCGCDRSAWPRQLSALYYTKDAHSEALALALADRLWLRPHLLLPPRVPAAHLAGALDYLGRQRAGTAVIVVAPHAVTAPAVTTLLQLERAHELSEAAAGVRRLVFVDDD